MLRNKLFFETSSVRLFVHHIPQRAIAITVSSAFATLLSPAASVLAADGMPGTHASSSQGGGGGGGGSLNTINGNSGNGGPGGVGGSGQGSSSGASGGQGTINGAISTSGGVAGSGGPGNNGSSGTAYGSGAGGGGGGGGAISIILSANGSNSGAIVGGNGGIGGNGGQNDSHNPVAGNGGNGGDGGAGGSGVLINIAASYDNNGTVRGGNGGSGGNTGSALASATSHAGTTLLGGSGGRGGQGGDGITATAGGNIVNGTQGEISGGDGATGGIAADSDATANSTITAVGGTGGIGSKGGSGVFLSGVSDVINSGSIRGGNGGNGNNGGAARGVNTVSGGNGAVAGDGGTGAWVSGSGTIKNLLGGRILGGTGGTGGGGSSLNTGATIIESIGASGGLGGSGVKLTEGGDVTNAGLITGGAGNRGGGSGNSTNGEHGGNSGHGGAGIEIISDGSVVNTSTGVVSGGNGGDDSAGGGGVGGIGGSGATITGGGNVTNDGIFTGGNGGTGASAVATGGDGAAGGAGLEVLGAGVVVNNAGASIIGGSGGNGGTAQTGGAGGDGGNGVLVSAGGDVINAGTITGGRGNHGGNGNNADGGDGGIGVLMVVGGGTITNTGEIIGGQGGNHGVASTPGLEGAGGVGISGLDMTIINSGSLSGGFSQDGLHRADAVQFTGGSNSLELQAGYAIYGNVDARVGNNTLILGGAKDSTFNVSQVGSSAQYQGFTAYHKTGNNIWTLFGSSDAVTPWTLYSGILLVDQENSLGAADSSLTFDGGTLRLNAQFDLAATRDVILESAGGTLDTQGYDIAVAHDISGSGGLTKQGTGRLTLNGANTYTGLTDVVNGTVTLGNTGLINGPVRINNPATFEIEGSSTDGAGNYTSSNALSGGGLLKVNLQSAGNTFTFSSSKDLAFSGVLELQKSAFALSGENSTALTNAILQTDAGNTITIGNGTQTISGAAFNGGSMIFGATIPASIKSDSLLQTDVLVAGANGYTQNGRNYLVDGTGEIRVAVPSTWNDPGAHNLDTTLNLLEQDDGDIGIQLIKATKVIGSGGELILNDLNGNAIGTGQVISISQNGTAVANGLYDYRLTTAPGDGLYVNYGLKQLNLLNGQVLILSERPGATGAAADLSAQITGSGNLGVNTGGLISLSNGLNDYSGATLVQTGTLRTDASGALGNTSELSISDSAVVDLNETTQTVAVLTGLTGSILNINAGTLTLSNGGLSQGSLTGSGNLNVKGGALDIQGNNSGLSTTTTINNGAEVILHDAQGAGTGDIVNGGSLALNAVTGLLMNRISGTGTVQVTKTSDVTVGGDNSAFNGLLNIDKGSNLRVDNPTNMGTAIVTNDGLLTVAANNEWNLNNTINGSGDLTKTGTGMLKMTQSAAGYTGTTDIMAGEIELGDKASAPVDMASMLVNVHSGAVLSGFGSTAGDVNIMPGGTLQVDFTVGGNLSNQGIVLLNHRGLKPGNQLVVKGNYTGNNGLMVFNTVLGGDDSPTDRFTVHGDTAGSTQVSVNNIGGIGARTVNGIQLIQVEGNSAGTFTQTGRIVAGAYDYALVRGKGVDAKNWYLTNDNNPETNPLLPRRATIVNPPAGLRSESGSYISNLSAVNTLFNHRLHDRLGEPQYSDALRSEGASGSLWMRQIGGHEVSSAAGGELKTQANRYVLQMGGDLAQWSSDGLDRWHLGTMWGVANESSNTRSQQTGYHSVGSVSGYSAGVYGTWYQNEVEAQGLYVDSWLLYNWFDSQVKGEGLGEEKYHAKGITTSLESGYTLKAGEFFGSQGTLNIWYVQPQAQAILMDVGGDSHREDNGTKVTTLGNDNLQTRLGVKTYLSSHHKMDDGNYREFQPFVEINWIRNTKSYGVSMNGQNISRDGARNLGEIRTGVEGKLNNNLSVWGNIGVQIGNAGYSDVQGLLGVKYGF